ncbi:MAG TPA: hypothetical protein VLJ10_04925, partial [Candidatus Bathyarchaeia archaeon]|nr:hypothetical protein [Candidatus Bathyarchaeia archaeon]
MEDIKALVVGGSGVAAAMGTLYLSGDERGAGGLKDGLLAIGVGALTAVGVMKSSSMIRWTAKGAGAAWAQRAKLGAATLKGAGFMWGLPAKAPAAQMMQTSMLLSKIDLKYGGDAEDASLAMNVFRSIVLAPGRGGIAAVSRSRDVSDALQGRIAAEQKQLIGQSEDIFGKVGGSAVSFMTARYRTGLNWVTGAYQAEVLLHPVETAKQFLDLARKPGEAIKKQTESDDFKWGHLAWIVGSISGTWSGTKAVQSGLVARLGAETTGLNFINSVHQTTRTMTVVNTVLNIAGEGITTGNTEGVLDHVKTTAYQMDSVIKGAFGTAVIWQAAISPVGAGISRGASKALDLWKDGTGKTVTSGVLAYGGTLAHRYAMQWRDSLDKATGNDPGQRTEEKIWANVIANVGTITAGVGFGLLLNRLKPTTWTGENNRFQTYAKKSKFFAGDKSLLSKMTQKVAVEPTAAVTKWGLGIATAGAIVYGSKKLFANYAINRLDAYLNNEEYTGSYLEDSTPHLTRSYFVSKDKPYDLSNRGLLLDKKDQARYDKMTREAAISEIEALLKPEGKSSDETLEASRKALSDLREAGYDKVSIQRLRGSLLAFRSEEKKSQYRAMSEERIRGELGGILKNLDPQSDKARYLEAALNNSRLIKADLEGILIQNLIDARMDQDYRAAGSEGQYLIDGKVIKRVDGAYLSAETYETTDWSNLILNGILVASAFSITRNYRSKYTQLLGSPDEKSQLVTKVKEGFSDYWKNTLKTPYQKAAGAPMASAVKWTAAGAATYGAGAALQRSAPVTKQTDDAGKAVVTDMGEDENEMIRAWGSSLKVAGLAMIGMGAVTGIARALDGVVGPRIGIKVEGKPFSLAGAVNIVPTAMGKMAAESANNMFRVMAPLAGVLEGVSYMSKNAAYTAGTDLEKGFLNFTVAGFWDDSQVYYDGQWMDRSIVKYHDAKSWVGVAGRAFSSGLFGYREDGTLRVSSIAEMPLTVQALLPGPLGGSDWKGDYRGLQGQMIGFSVGLAGLRGMEKVLNNISWGNFGLKFRAMNHAFDKTFELDMFKVKRPDSLAKGKLNAWAKNPGTMAGARASEMFHMAVNGTVEEIGEQFAQMALQMTPVGYLSPLLREFGVNPVRARAIA